MILETAEEGRVFAMELSTCHMSYQDSLVLKDLAANFNPLDGEPPYVFDTCNGFIIMIGELTVARIIEQGVSIALQSILNGCLVHQVQYLAFDKDSTELENLPTYDW